MEKSIAWELLKVLKRIVIAVSIFAILELGVIGYLGYLLYDSQFEYSQDKTQQIQESELENVMLTQN